MLVTLGTNTPIAAGGSVTFPYACRSVQKIYIKMDDTVGGNAYDHFITVQLGSRTIANGLSAHAVTGYQALIGGKVQSGTEVAYQIDLGSHNLLDNENLYVTIRCATALDAVDVSATVDSTDGNEYPIRYTEYSDNTFTAENVLMAISYKNDGSAVDEDASNIELRDPVSSSSPTFISASNWFMAETFNNNSSSSFGLLKKQQIPLTTTFNYPSSATANRICVASLMGTNQRAVSQGQRQRAIAKSQVGK